MLFEMTAGTVEGEFTNAMRVNVGGESKVINVERHFLHANESLFFRKMVPIISTITMKAENQFSCDALSSHCVGLVWYSCGMPSQPFANNSLN